MEHTNPNDAPQTETSTTSLEADPWRRTLATGLELLLLSWLLIFVSFRWQSRLGGPEWLWELLGLIPGLIEVCGFWLVTTPDPNTQLESAHTVRLITRWLAVALEVGEVIATVAYLAGWFDYEAGIVIVLPLLGIHVAIFAIYLCSVARRIGRRGFIWQTKVAFWGLSLGLFCLAPCIPFVSAWGAAKDPQPLQLIFVAITFLLMLVFGIWSVVLAWRYRKALSVS